MRGVRILLSAAIAALAPAAAGATVFSFSETVGSYQVTGTFQGTLNGNLITNITNASAYVNGQAFMSNGSLYVLSWNNSSQTWSTSGATASLDGTQNNFGLFDFANQNTIQDDFFSVNASGYTGGDYIYYNQGQIAQQNPSPTDNFRAQVTAVPEPASWAMMLVGFGLAGMMLRRRERSAMTFG